MINPNLIGVRVVYRNRNMTPTSAKTYTLQEYTGMLREDLLRLVTNVEDLCYEVNNNRPKEEWSEETFTAFNKIKHKLLDKAGEIGRMPENLVERVQRPLNEFISELIDGKAEDRYGESRLGSAD